MSEEIPSVSASYISRCPLCDEYIAVGDEISMYEYQWCHTECCEDALLGDEVEVDEG